MDEPLLNKIACAVEYWCECQMKYQRYVEIYLSQTESYKVEFGQKSSPQPVSCIWRVVVLQSQASLPSKALLGCLRFDSYFNPCIVPNFEAAINVRDLQLRLYNQLELTGWRPPKILSEYSLGGAVPCNQRFATLEMKIISLLVNRWPTLHSSSPMILVHAGARLCLRLLDYGLLLDQSAVDSADCQLRLLSQSSPAMPKLEVSLICEPFVLKLSPSSCHTIASSIQLWLELLQNADSCNKSNMITARYVIANDTNVPIRFCQNSCEDGVLLESRQCYFYSWLQSKNQVSLICILILS